MPVAPEPAAGGPVYFAWVDADETAFGPEHIRYDEYIFKLNIHLEEGQIPTATLTMKNPGALLALGRNLWVVPTGCRAPEQAILVVRLRPLCDPGRRRPPRFRPGHRHAGRRLRRLRRAGSGRPVRSGRRQRL
mgnify:CR=1 FL=1